MSGEEAGSAAAGLAGGDSNQASLCSWKSSSTGCICLGAVKLFACRGDGCKDFGSHMCQAEWENEVGDDSREVGLGQNYCPHHHPFYVPASVGGAAGLAAAGVGGGEATDPEHGIVHCLPALFSIWDCPMINKITGFDDNGKSFAGWTCGWCPLETDGSKPKPFRSTNATKALVHVSKLTGFDIRPCRGRIPTATSKQYQELYLSKTVSKEERKSKKDVMNSTISNIQDQTVVSLADGAISLSRQSL